MQTRTPPRCVAPAAAASASPPRLAAASVRAFTLVEIMIVVALIGLVLTMGMPSIVQVGRKEPLRQAVSDLVEALSDARAQAILQGVPADMILRAGDGQLMVLPARPAPSTSRGPDAGAPSPSAEPGLSAGSQRPVFSAHLHPDIAITLIYVNLTDRMQSEEVHVRFYPNGTCDDFTMVMESKAGVRKVSLDPITGIPDVVTVR